MANLNDDVLLNRRLAHDRSGRQFVPNASAEWGKRILPAPDERAGKTDVGLRLVL